MLLGDAITLAQRERIGDQTPSELLTVATLTGAIQVAVCLTTGACNCCELGCVGLSLLRRVRHARRAVAAHAGGVVSQRRARVAYAVGAPLCECASE
jgi:hypothetical protein